MSVMDLIAQGVIKENFGNSWGRPLVLQFKYIHSIENKILKITADIHSNIAAPIPF